MKSLKITYLLILYTCVWGQNSDFENIYNKYTSTNCFQTDFNQALKIGSTGENKIFSGKLFFKKDNRFRVELDGNTIVSDGIDLWNYDKNLDRVVINPITDDESVFNIQTLLEGFKNKFTEKVIVPGKQLELTSNSSNFSSVILYYSNGFIIEKMELTDSMNNKISIKLTNTVFDIELKDSLFNFSPPQGSRIVDLR